MDTFKMPPKRKQHFEHDDHLRAPDYQSKGGEDLYFVSSIVCEPARYGVKYHTVDGIRPLFGDSDELMPSNACYDAGKLVTRTQLVGAAKKKDADDFVEKAIAREAIFPVGRTEADGLYLRFIYSSDGVDVLYGVKAFVAGKLVAQVDGEGLSIAPSDGKLYMVRRDVYFSQARPSQVQPGFLLPDTFAIPSDAVEIGKIENGEVILTNAAAMDFFRTWAVLAFDMEKTGDALRADQSDYLAGKLRAIIE